MDPGVRAMLRSLWNYVCAAALLPTGLVLLLIGAHEHDAGRPLRGDVRVTGTVVGFRQSHGVGILFPAESSSRISYGTDDGGTTAFWGPYGDDRLLGDRVPVSYVPGSSTAHEVGTFGVRTMVVGGVAEASGLLLLNGFLRRLVRRVVGRRRPAAAG